jgi:hypothetical protein
LHVEFFDECLESFQVSDFREVDGKPNIDVDSAYSHVDKTYLKMPEQNPGQDVAHHVFSVLSYFFQDDRPFIVLAETKPSKRHIPVWARYSSLRTRVEAHANTLSP